MKIQKLILFFALGAMSMNAVAAIDAQAVIKIAGQETSDEVTLYQDPAATDNYASNNNNTPDSYNTISSVVVNAWVVAGSANYTILNAPSLNNLEIKFKANAYETAYTMTFSNVSGNEIILVTASNDTLIANNDSTYAITCAINEEITFIINPAAPVYTRTVTANDWGTLCLPWATPNKTSLEGATFYEALGTKDPEQGIALAEVDSLEAGKPYVFHATATEIKVTYDAATEVDDTVPTNHVTGSFAGCNVPKDMYLIVDNLLYKAADATNTIGANRAYFDVASMTAYTPAPGRRVVLFGGKTTPTALEAAEAPAMKDGKMMIDGQLIIIKGGKMFNAQGAAL